VQPGDNKNIAKSDRPETLDVPEWASDWALFLSRLYNRQLVLRCPDCDGPATVSVDDQDANGILVECDDTQSCAHFELVKPQEMLQIVGMGGDR
jgi:hypothetical protein